METLKEHQYAALLAAKIVEIFDEDSEIKIDRDELQEGSNLTHFFHALANVMPNLLYNQITGDEKNNLEFNHMANHLVMQYSKKETSI